MQEGIPTKDKALLMEYILILIGLFIVCRWETFYALFDQKMPPLF